LEEAIGRSKAVAILVGPHGIGNTQQYERELALIRQTQDKALPVVPVLMPGCDSPPTGFLQLLTWVDFSKDASILRQTERLADLRAALRGETVASAIRASICPYRGLEPFREEDAGFFCGRDDAIGQLVARVQEHALVAVVGPSGSGKSSLVFAGLVPALRKQTTMWDVVTLRPGKSPLTALAAGFGRPPGNAGPAAIDTWLEGEAAAYRAGDKDTLARIVDLRLDKAPERPDRLLVYVDQWEELDAMAPPQEDKERRERHSADVERFIELLVAAASGAGSRASVVMTVRADFYNPLIRNPLLAALLPKQQVNIPPMSRDDLRLAIETPAKTAGLSFAPPQLVDRILDDVGLEEGRLPLLQFALKEIWQRREGDRLTAEAYTEAGGVAGAIERTAEDAYERLTPSQKDAARRLFLRLVTPGEGQADTRVRSVIPDDPEQRGIVRLFANPKTRLLVTGYETLQGAAQAASEARSTVEVAHEALIQRWKTLRDWVGANRENMRARAAILRFKAEWEENGKSEKFLLDPGVQLERGRALLANPGDVPLDDIRPYVSLSIKRQQRELDRANQAIARSIVDELVVTDWSLKDVLSELQRNALWKLAVADDQVKANVVSELADSPRNLLRVTPFFDRAYRALGLLRPSPVEAGKLFATAIVASRTVDWKNKDLIGAALENLARKLTQAEVPEALERVVCEIDRTTDDLSSTAVLYILERALKFLPITELQAQKTLRSVLAQIDYTAAPFTIIELMSILRALPVTPTAAQVRSVLSKLLQQLKEAGVSAISQPSALEGPAMALAMVASVPGLTEKQAGLALDPVLTLISGETRPELGTLDWLVFALGVLPVKLSEAQAQQALGPVLDQIGQATDAVPLKEMAHALGALAAKLTEPQAKEAFCRVLNRIYETTDSDALLALARACRALAVRLTERQAQQVLEPVLDQIGQATDPDAYFALAQALQSLPAKLNDAQAEKLVDLVFRQNLARAAGGLRGKWVHEVFQGQRTFGDLAGALAHAFLAFVAKLTETQAKRALEVVVDQICQTDDQHALLSLAPTFQILAAKLSDEQGRRVSAAVLEKFGQTIHHLALLGLAQVIRALPSELAQPPARQALDIALDMVARETEPNILARLAEAIHDLPTQLTEEQAQQGLDPIVNLIGQTTKPDALRSLARALQVLATKATKLTDTQVRRTWPIAKSWLAWAGTEIDAAGWAWTLVALLDHVSEPVGTGELVTAIAYPSAAGPATEVLLDAIRARHPDAPTQETGTDAVLQWLAKKHPLVLRPPVCPSPPQPFEISGLKCPSQETAASK
jgi:hypothetical protein